MKKLTPILLLLLFLLAPMLATAAVRSVSADTDGLLLSPSTFFMRNSNSIDAAISQDILGNVNATTLRSVTSTNTGGYTFLAGWTNNAGLMTNAGTFQNLGNVGFGGTFQVAGASTFAGFTTTTSSNSSTALIAGNAGFGGTLTIAGAIIPSSTINFADDVRQTFNPGANASGLNVGSLAGDPATPSNGDIWYNSSTPALRARVNGASVSLGSGGGGDDKVATNAGTAWNPTFNLRSTVTGNFADTATNMTHATHNEYVVNDHRLARMSMGADMIVGIVHPTTATAVGMIGRVRVLSTGGAITWSNITGRSAVPLNTGTNMFYIHWDGTNCWVEAGQLATSGSGDHFALTNAPTISDINLIGSARLPNGSSVTTDAFGELGADNNAWAASRGALQFFDGTANTWILGVLASDTPSDLQVPKFNTSTGTITWENDNNSGAATALNDIADPTADGEVAMAGFRQSYTSTLTAGVANTITNSVADLSSDTFLQEWAYRDNADANAFFWKATHNAGGSIAAQLSSAAFQWNVASSNSSTHLNAGNVGLGGTLTVAGASTFAATTSTTSSNSSTALVSGNAGFGGNVTSAGEFIGAYNGATAGSTLKFKSFLWLKGPDLVQNGGMLPNTNDVTAVTFGKVRFSNSADEASNYAEYHVMVPEDIDTSVDLRARVIFRLTGADTGTHRYVLSLDDVANSGAYTGTVGNAINLDFAGDGSGASGDVESVGLTTLTGWAGAMTAGRHLVIRIARDGNATEDGSTVDSDLSIVGIEYGVSQ